MRLGVFGGSFDPVHYGHLLLAEYCRTEQRLDEVWFVPTAVSPHKLDAEPTAAPHRVEMLKLAIAGHEPFRLSALEVERGGVSYTVDTLRTLKGEEPHRELFLLVGSDTLLDLPHWKAPEEICSLATLVVVRRAGTPAPDFSCLAETVSPDRIATFERHQVVMPLIELSSTEIRRRVATGRSIRFQTPRAVERYIETNGLYVPDDQAASRDAHVHADRRMPNSSRSCGGKST